MKQSKVLRLVFIGFLSMIILSLILILIFPQSEIDFPNNNIQHPAVFIIGIDGIGNLPQIVDTPGIHRIINNGVYSFDAQTVYPSLSAECWTSLLHGVRPEKHEIRSIGGLFIFKRARPPFPLSSQNPSIFRLMHEKDNRSKMASFSNWKDINEYIIEDGINVYKYYSGSEKRLVDKFEKYMRTNDPWLVFFQLDDTDEVGHGYGFFSNEQKKQLMKTDKTVSRIIDIIEKYDINNESLILVLSDHGGGGDYYSENGMPRPSFICEKCVHGSGDPIDMTIFWTARGKGICKSKKIEHHVSILDTAKFVASYLKLKIPETWDGYDLYPELQCQ